MANGEHLEVLKKGVKAWNECNKGDLSLKLDLGGADFTSARINGVETEGARGFKTLQVRASVYRGR